MPITELLARWQANPETADNLTAWKIQPARPPTLAPLPEDVPPALRSALKAHGIVSLYSHQAVAWHTARQDRNLVLATGTASGKSLAYNLPVLSKMVEDPSARAIYLFPTKALTQDQLHQLQPLSAPAAEVRAAIYDGDTRQTDRQAIRLRARLILTNPDMLHTGILPHHAGWADLFENLRFVVIDEMHTYRGVFGSHVANVIRRLKRLAASYGSKPQFLLSSATIGNPQQLAEDLIEEDVVLIDDDGSGRGERHFLIYNPPVVNRELGLRKSAILEGVRLARDVLDEGLQGVVFARTRRTVEIMLTYLQAPQAGSSAHADQPGRKDQIRGYRSGYLPSQRRSIEQGLQDGSVRLAVATNALELGVDIGGLGSAILTGFPGSIASTRQQAGRAGRGMDAAVAMMIASPNPLDQYLAHHPEYFFGTSPERGLINPNHVLILLEHLRCAAFERPFGTEEGFGRLSHETIAEFLDLLVSAGELHVSHARYYWMADQYPAAGISLRSASPKTVVLQAAAGDGKPTTIGTVEAESAPWMVHPGAVYLHEAQQYYVQELDLEKAVAQLVPVALDYYTEPQRRTEVGILSTQAETGVAGGSKAHGELQVTTQVVGFRKMRWFTHENMGEAPLDLPPAELQTTGYWLSLSTATVDRLREAGAWTNDPNDYGTEWERIRRQVRERDAHVCQVCGSRELGRPHDVHHKVPFRRFTSADEANRLENLITICPTCHAKVELNQRVRSGLAGLAFVLGHLAPLFLMCDPGDLGIHVEPGQAINGHPTVVLYDSTPGGIGLSQALYEVHDELIRDALETVDRCQCVDGCPSCVGPGGENGLGGRPETRAILQELVG